MTHSPYRLAAIFVLLSSLLHFAAPLMGGSQVIFLMVFGVIYLGLTAGLNRGMRPLAYLTFFVMGIGGIAALSQIWANGPLPGWWWGLIVAADWAAFGALFIALWRPAPTTTPTA